MSVDLNRLTAHLSPQQQDEVKKAYHRQAEHSTAAFLYCFFLGIVGAHRFYLRQWGKGLAHLILPVLAAIAVVAGIALNVNTAIIALIVILLLVIALIWEIINLFTIDAEVYQHNLKLAEQLVAHSLLADTTVERRAEAKLDAMLTANEAVAVAAAEQARAASDAAAEAAVAPAPMAAVVPETPVAGAEDVAVSNVRDAVAAVSVGQYAETSVTQISDDSGTRQADASAEQSQAPTSWSETVGTRDSETSTAAGPAETAAVIAAGAGVAEAAVAEEESAQAEIASYWDAVTRAHQESGYSVTDSMERTATYGFGEARDTTEEVVAAAEPLPTVEEAAAATWPDHLLTDVTDEGEVPQVAQPEVIAAPVAFAASPTPESALASTRDVTDMGFVNGEPKPLADIASEGGVPLSVALPGSADVLVGVAEIVAAQPAAPEPAAVAAEESVLVLVPEEGESQSTGSAYYEAADASDATFPMSNESPSAAGGYEAPFPPPFIPEAAAAAAVASYAALSSDTPTLVPDQQSGATSTGQPDGETLAELAGYGSTAATEHTDPSAEPPAQGTAQAGSAGEEEYHATHTAGSESEHHLMRRIRVVRQVKVDGQVVEETAAEEFIDADADPEPVRQRLQEMLRQQASGQQQDHGGAQA